MTCIIISLLTLEPDEVQIVGLAFGTLTTEQKAANKASYGWIEVAASLFVIVLGIEILVYFTG